MLAVINGAPGGAELFIADPFRFLAGHRYVVPPALQAQMESAAPALAKTSKQLCEGIAAGSASLVVAPHPFTVTGNVSCIYQSFNDTNVENVADAKISVFPTVQPSPPVPIYPGQTDTNGAYSIGPVNPGTYTGDYTVLVEATKVGSQKQQIPQPSGTSFEQDFQFEKWVGPPPHTVTPGTPVTPGTGM